ncbi:MAG: hypothetical protein JKY32_07260 [Rhizobiales bacterium]|nr:hypothetical protein [Hyphomicrobiales bacterium]
MAFTFTTLKTNIADFLNRDDLTAVIPVFIELAEARINRDLRHWQMESRSETTFDERYEDLPDDWVETIRITVDDKFEVTLVSQAKMQELRQHDDSGGRPRHYTFSTGQVEFWPSPDSSYSGSMIYVATIDALSNTNPDAGTNWLLETSPDVYLYGSLLHSAPYLAEDPRIQIWAGLYQEAMTTLNNTSDAAKWSGVGLVMR